MLGLVFGFLVCEIRWMWYYVMNFSFGGGLVLVGV